MIRVLLLLFPILAFAQSDMDRALQLNQEMDFMLEKAPNPQVWSRGSLPPVAQRSGAAPTQMKEELMGVENVEDRYFEDSISTRQAGAAPADAPSDLSEFEDPALSY